MPAKSTPAKESTAVEVYDKEDEIEYIAPTRKKKGLIRNVA